MKKLHLSIIPMVLMPLWVVPVQAEDTPFDKPLLGTRLEQQTPAGAVPPATGNPLAAALPDEQHYLAEPGSQFKRDDAAAVLEHFREAYRRGGTPRMAIYFNRELSDEVREWVPGTQHKVTTTHAHASSFNSLQTGPISAQGTTTGTIESQSRYYTGDTGKRPDLHEPWQWQFEESITAALLDGGANIVDRAVIFRQMARQSPQTAGMDGSMSTILNEISALDAFADVLIEMKVTRSSTDFGYDFRAVARNVQTGQIIGTALVNGNQVQHQSGAVAAASGYTMRTDNYLVLEQVTQELTFKLMQSLSKYWNA